MDLMDLMNLMKPGPTLDRPCSAPSTVAALAPLGWPALVIAGCTLVLLVSLSGRYGYHRDELYFLEAGRHLAWGYPDQPPFVPLLARLISELAPGSLVVLRLPSAVAAGGVILLTALLARELGGGRAAQALAAVSMAISGLLLGTGHLLSTATFNLLAWSLLLWLVLRILRTGNQRLWLVVGVVSGIGLLNNDLVIFLIAALVVGLAIVGPRRILGSPWLWVGAAIAALLWAPYLVWQAQHGWPELAVSRSIAAGGSGTSTPRSLLLPEQLVLVSPYLAPVWIFGLVRYFRDPALRWCRAIGPAYVVLCAAVVVTGGKAYYLAAYVPVLLGAGAQPTIAWLGRGRATLRRTLIALALVSTAAGTVLFALPVLPVGFVHRTPLVSLNYDAGETIGWPTFVAQIAEVYDHVPPSQRGATSILASNYGEAGAVDRFGPAFGLPHAFSGDDGFWYWGPPPSSAHTLVAIGFGRQQLERSFAHCQLHRRLDNGVGVDNQEQGQPVWVCTTPRASWRVLWPRFRVLS
jgi:4-amino-4-deoxy-L-arabinose transferase-like glycosyltransferase